MQHATGLQAGAKTTTNAARITDTEERAGAHKIQVWHDSQGQLQEHEENQGQDAGGQGNAGSEDKKKTGATSGLSHQQGTAPSIATHEGCHDTKRRRITHGKLYKGGVRDPSFL